MARIFATLALFCVAVYAAPHHEPGHVESRGSEHKVNVAVFYESLCPDSIKFVKEQLVPFYKNAADLADHVDLTLVPFGKASWVKGANGQRTEFTCQHQAPECEGNMAQACAIREIERSVKEEDRQRKMVDLVGCAMADSSPSTAVPKCAEKIGMSQDSIDRIENCRKSEEGDNLLIQHGEKTYAFEKPIQSVPSVSIEGKKNSDARYKFKEVICSLLPDSKDHDSCRS